MIKLIIKPVNTLYTLDIPPKYLNKEIEITLLPIHKETKRNQAKMIKNLLDKKDFNVFSKIENPLQWQEGIRKEWL